MVESYMDNFNVVELQADRLKWFRGVSTLGADHRVFGEGRQGLGTFSCILSFRHTIVPFLTVSRPTGWSEGQLCSQAALSDQKHLVCERAKKKPRYIMPLGMKRYVC